MKKIIQLFMLVVLPAWAARQPEVYITRINNESNKNLELTIGDKSVLTIPAHTKIDRTIEIPFTLRSNESQSESLYTTEYTKLVITNDQYFTLYFARKQDPRYFYGQTSILCNLDYIKPSTKEPGKFEKTQVAGYSKILDYAGNKDQYLIPLHFIQDANGNVVPATQELVVGPILP